MDKVEKRRLIKKHTEAVRTTEMHERHRIHASALRRDHLNHKAAQFRKSAKDIQYQINQSIQS